MTLKGFMDDDEESDEYYTHQKGGLPKHLLIPFVLALLGIWIFFYNKSFAGNAAFIYSTWLFLVFIFTRNIETEMKLKSPKLIAPGDFTSYKPSSTIDLGDYVIFRREGADIGEFGMKGGGRHGIVVVPKACVNNFGPSVGLTAQLIPIPFDALPHRLKPHIAPMIKSTSPILYGIAAPEFYPETLAEDMTSVLENMGVSEQDIKRLEDAGIHKPSVSYLVSTIIDQNKTISELRKITDMKYSDITKFADAAFSIGERKSLGQSLKGVFTDKKDQ